MPTNNGQVPQQQTQTLVDAFMQTAEALEQQRVREMDHAVDFGPVNPTPQAPIPAPEPVMGVRINRVEYVPAASVLVIGINRPYRATIHWQVGADWMRDDPMMHAVGHAMADAMQRALDLPTPERREIPTATLGERMFNLLSMLSETGGFTQSLDNEITAITMEYEQYMTGRERR